MHNAYSRHKDKSTAYADIFKSFLKLIANYQKLGLISQSTSQTLGKMPIVQDMGNPVKNLAEKANFWVEISEFAKKLISQMEMPDPLATSVTSTLKKTDLIRMIQIMTAQKLNEEDTNLTSRLLQQVVRLEDRIEQLEKHILTIQQPTTTIIETQTPTQTSNTLTGSTSNPRITILRSSGDYSEVENEKEKKKNESKLLAQIDEQNKKLLRLQEKTDSLAVFCSPKSSKKNQTTEISFSPPYDQRVYKKPFTASGLKWELQLYPKGKTEDQRGYSSFFIKLVSSHIDEASQALHTKIEITSQLLSGTIQENFVSGSTFGYAKAFEARKLRAKVDFKLKFSFPTPISAHEKIHTTDKLKRQLYL